MSPRLAPRDTPTVGGRGTPRPDRHAAGERNDSAPSCACSARLGHVLCATKCNPHSSRVRRRDRWIKARKPPPRVPARVTSCQVRRGGRDDDSAARARRGSREPPAARGADRVRRACGSEGRRFPARHFAALDLRPGTRGRIGAPAPRRGGRCLWPPRRPGGGSEALPSPDRRRAVDPFRAASTAASTAACPVATSRSACPAAACPAATSPVATSRSACPAAAFLAACDADRTVDLCDPRAIAMGTSLGCALASRCGAACAAAGPASGATAPALAAAGPASGATTSASWAAAPARGHGGPPSGGAALPSRDVTFFGAVAVRASLRRPAPASGDVTAFGAAARDSAAVRTPPGRPGAAR
jgi:hypothetical protein